MRKFVLPGAIAVLAVVLSGCSKVTGDSGSDEKTPSAPAGAAQSSGPANAAPSNGAPAGASSSGLSGAALQLANARDKATSVQTYKAHTELEQDGALTSKSDIQIRMGDSFAYRSVTTTMPAAYQAMNLPNMPTEPQTSESLMLPGVMYSSNSPQILAMTGGKPWSKMAMDTAALESSKPQDFRAQLALMLKSGDVREMGKETVDGVATTHYAGTVSLLTLNDNSAADVGLSDEQYQGMRKLWADLGYDNAKIDLWIGADALPVRQITVTTAKPGAKVGPTHVTTTKATTTFSDWGKPIDDTPPPAEDVEEISLTDLPSLPPAPKSAF